MRWEPGEGGEVFPNEWVANRDLGAFWQQQGREMAWARAVRRAQPRSVREVMAGVRRAHPTGDGTEEAAARHDQRVKRQQEEREARRVARAGGGALRQVRFGG